VSEYIVNPRRGPRAPSRCAALVHTPDANWSTETEDIGPMGCQLVAPRAVARGLPLTLVFANWKVQESLQVEGKVAWACSQPPWRIGVAFGDSSRSQAAIWFAQLMAAHPELGGFRRVPDRLPVDAMLFLTPPPTYLIDFTPDEVAVLCHVANGTSIASLRGRLEPRWSASLRAVFSLMARGVLTLSRSSAAHLSAWKKVMADLDAEFVLEQQLASRPAPSLQAFLVEVPFAAAPVAAAPVAAAPGSATAGFGWRGGARLRSREAQESFDLGRTELAAGRANSALAHLRRALQLAPGDPDIATEIGRAMLGG
jgi:PilZ domain